MEEFHVSPADLHLMQEIGRVSSYHGDKDRWTNISLFHRTGFNRPYVALVEGFERGYVDGQPQSQRFSWKFAALGTIDRALRWFDESELTETLRLQVEGWTPPARARPKPIGYDGPASLHCLLAWLYERHDASDAALARLVERDFGVGERTVRDLLRKERDAPDMIAPGSIWFPPFLAAMRHFNRLTWLETIANTNVDTTTTAATSPARSDKGNTDGTAQSA